MSSILYQNASQTVTLLDVPRSISEVSGLQTVAAVGPTTPYTSTEPKGSKRAKALSSVPEDEKRYHEKIAELTRTALVEVRQYIGQRSWCLNDTTHALHKADKQNGNMVTLKQHMATTTELPTRFTPPLVLSTLENRYPSVADLQDLIVANPSTSTVRTYISERSFLIPPRATFLLSSIQHGANVIELACNASNGLSGAIDPGLFNLILLDPPWPNRSVRNARAYNTSERQGQLHPYYQTLPIVSRHLSRSGTVGVWITNKRAIRETVLRSLREMGLDVYEEWIWLKTTSNGEPVTALDGLWRKPYEVLLLFGRKDAVRGGQPARPPYPEVKRRVIIAVPDTHSRKPCLKELLKPLMPESYRALEVFARNLTAGWWSWGDEVLKFNEKGSLELTSTQP
jgi:N6-adenosine-specific RNA methylase IME4